MKLSIIILNYNVTELLRACLSSVKRYVQDIDYEVIVIDNASPDTSWKNLVKEFPTVYFIENPKNQGFSIANNIAAENAKGEYLYFLNPDTELEGNYMSEILSFADGIENFGCLGLRMHNFHGNFLPESKRAVPDMFNSFEKLFNGFKKNQSKSYYRNDVGEYEIAEVEVITGANLLIKRKIYEEIGGFDGRYFMYGEDIDLCYTLLQHGYRNFYYGKYSILHHKGESTVKDKFYLKRFYGAMKIFIEKYYRKEKPLQYFLLLAGLQLRYWFQRLKL